MEHIDKTPEIVMSSDTADTWKRKKNRAAFVCALERMAKEIDCEIIVEFAEAIHMLE